MLNARSIQGILILVVGIFIAIWLGIALVTNQLETLAKFAAAGLLITCILLGRKIWLLLLFFIALDVPIIRGFRTVEIGQALFLVFTFIMFLMRRQPLKLRFGELEVWMLLLAASIAQTYIRNPVGIALLGADAVGARPYVMAAMAFMTGAVLGNIAVRSSDIKWAMWLTIIGSFLSLPLNMWRMRGMTPEEMTPAMRARYDDGLGAGRISWLGNLGILLSRVIVSFVSPLRALLHPVWAPLILISVAAAAGSGFRNSVAAVGLIYLIGIAYRGGFGSLAISVLSGAMGLALLAFVNLLAPLPPNVQRALSPFPGTWNERYTQQAADSTEWRVEMWKEALFTDYWIKNKLLGDGLGMTRRELELMVEATEGSGRGFGVSGSGLTVQQETMMVNGGYHSGPVQTVRTTGYIGLFILLITMIRMAVHAHRQILRCRDTEWYPMALFFFIPTIAMPFIFTFIVGGFGVDVAATFISYAMVRMFEKNLPLPAYVPKHRVVHVPLVMRNRLGEEQNARRV